ncbi:nuclear condensing complex subunit [Mycena amicta]|nr:nuclear condensing complex subunit [Mycena amicta]
MPGRVVDVQREVAAIFEQVQNSTANHQKNLVAAYKLHSRSTVNPQGNKDDRGEHEFRDAFFTAIAAVLPVKKGATAADRVVKFVGSYFQYLNERAPDEDQPEEEDADDITTLASRFMNPTLEFLLRGFKAKDKNVRYRVVDFVAGMVAEMGTIDDDTYLKLRTELMERVYDKEGTIRMKVVVSLSRLAEGEDLNELEEGQQSILQLLLDTMTTDPSAEVRRIAAANMPIDPLTDEIKAALLSRLRDKDASVRKIMYSQVLEKGARARNSFHPRSLTITERELIVRNGLGDREASVRAAAASMIEAWFENSDLVKSEDDLALQLEEVDISDKASPEDRKKQKAMKDLTGFLSLFYLQDESDNNGEMRRGKVASDALRSLLSTVKDLAKNVLFGDDFFDDLTIEKVFLARVFVEHCADGREDLLEECGIPVVTRCAFRIQDWCNKLIEEDDSSVLVAEDREELQHQTEFIAGELLTFAVHLDYGDETGRRKMDLLIRNMLGLHNIPLSLVTRLTTDEKDLIRQVVEIISNLRDSDEGDDETGDRSLDSIDPDESFSSQRTPRKKPVRKDLTPHQQRAADAIDLRCLALCIALLERLDGTFAENSTLQGVFDELIMPSVVHKNPELQLQGLVAFGLSCLVARNLATKFLPALLEQAKAARVSEAIRTTIFRIVFDVLLAQTNLDSELKKNSLDFLLNEFETQCKKKGDGSPETLAVLSLGLGKLILHSLVDDPKTVMMSLLRAYYSPYNRENQPLLQCLTYFINMYSRCGASNQRIMQELFQEIFKETAEMYREFQENEDEVVNLDLANVTGMWVECTNPLEVMDAQGAPGEKKTGDPMTQFALAEDILRLMLNEKNMPKEQKKLLCQMLGKLYIPDEIEDTDRIRSLHLLITHINLRRPVKDTTANNALKKFDTKFRKQFERQLEGFSEEEYRKMEQLKELFDFLDDIIPDDDEDEAPKKGRKRRSDSIVSATDDDAVSVASSKRAKSKPKAKRRRLSTSDDEDSNSDNNTIRGTPPPRRRRLPQRSAATKKKPQVVVISDEEDDDDDEDEDVPASRSRATSSSSRARKEEARLDAEIDNILDEGTSMAVGHDSIMDDSDSDDADEVNDLLVA